MPTIDRALGVLRLFAGRQSGWTVEAAARELGLKQSTAYQYFRSLVDSGLLSTYRTGLYVIGPAIIELDRQAREHDPLILAARDEMDAMDESLEGSDDVVLLCRLYKLTVMCVDQRAPTSPERTVSYERGRPMPLERGAASKVILSHLAPRVLRRYYDQTHADGLGPTWDEFRKPLRAIRRARLSITRGELDEGRIGISTAVFDAEGDVVGSIGLVVSEPPSGGGHISPDLAARIVEAGERVSARLKASS